jgi:hypothetical protein
VKRLLLTAAFVLTPCIIQPSMMAQKSRSAELKHIPTVPLNGSSRPVSLTAISIVRGAEYPTVISLKEGVEIKAPVCLAIGKMSALVCDGYMIVHADEVEFLEDSGEIQAHGNVQITPLHHAKN